MRFLDRTHLVGALDLAGALAAAGPLVDAAENPVLVQTPGTTTTYALEVRCQNAPDCAAEDDVIPAAGVARRLFTVG